MKIYFGFAKIIRNIKSIKTIYLLYELFELSKKNKILLNPEKRKYLCDIIKFDKAALSKALKQLISLNILFLQKRNEYILNPYLFKD